MKLVLANLEDLKNIQDIYTKIIENMYSNDMKIWNKYYPNEVFKSDIENNNLYLLKEKNTIIGAFAMYEHTQLENDVEWKDRGAKAYLINRVGVNVDYLHKGYGQEIIKRACKIAKKNGCKYLRLLVSEINDPAINLYLKCNFNKVEGIHKEIINDKICINEYGFEILLS